MFAHQCALPADSYNLKQLCQCETRGRNRLDHYRCHLGGGGGGGGAPPPAGGAGGVDTHPSWGPGGLKTGPIGWHLLGSNSPTGRLQFWVPVPTQWVPPWQNIRLVHHYPIGSHKGRDLHLCTPVCRPSAIGRLKH